MVENNYLSSTLKKYLYKEIYIERWKMEEIILRNSIFILWRRDSDSDADGDGEGGGMGRAVGVDGVAGLEEILEAGLCIDTDDG